jgi:hypothetical protein
MPGNALPNSAYADMAASAGKLGKAICGFFVPKRTI